MPSQPTEHVSLETITEDGRTRLFEGEPTSFRVS